MIAFGAPPELAVPSVFACRTVAVGLPAPAPIASVAVLRATPARWGREDIAAATANRSGR